MNILVPVAANSGENPEGRKGKVSLAMFVSQGLGGPKSSPNRKKTNRETGQYSCPRQRSLHIAPRDRRSLKVQL